MLPGLYVVPTTVVFFFFFFSHEESGTFSLVWCLVPGTGLAVAGIRGIPGASRTQRHPGQQYL